MEKHFEDINIQGLGNLIDFDGMNLSALRDTITHKSNYAIYTSKSDIPAGWPAQIMTTYVDEQHENRLINRWYMNLDGMGWKLFYSFDVTAYEELNCYPAFIYEKTMRDNDHIAYTPIVSMLIADDGKIIQALKTRTEKMIAAALEQAQRL